MRVKTTGAIALALVASGASAQNTIALYDLLDHPDGNQNPPPYGLRLDNIIGPGAATLSIDAMSNTQLRVLDDNGDIEIEITGTLFGGTVSGGSYDNPDSYEVAFTYAANVSASGGGWVVTDTDASNTGTLINTSTGDVIDLYTTPVTGDTFVFRPDGHRLSGDSESWVGRGWLTDQADGSAPYGGSQDWLFRAVEREVPSPGSLALLAIGGLTCVRRQR